MASRLTTADLLVQDAAAQDAPAGARPSLVSYESLKPPIESMLAIAALLVVWPVFVVVGLFVKADSPGPALYTQVRVGRDRRRGARPPGSGPDRRRRDLGGQPFKIVKFRSMEVNAEAKTGAVWAQGHDDPRITRVGKILRASHIDELPQLINVANGDMSLVGPRPERPEFFGGLATEVPNYRARTTVRPGITGLAQVLHKYDASLDDVQRKVEFDLKYIRAAGFTTDMKILAGTLLRCWDEFVELVRRRPRSKRRTLFPWA